MSITIFRRKIYDKMLEWKTNRSQKYSLLIKGARRVGKSTIAKEFAKKEFKSYILIDFAHASKAIIEFLRICMIWTCFSLNCSSSPKQGYMKMNL